MSPEDISEHLGKSHHWQKCKNPNLKTMAIMVIKNGCPGIHPDELQGSLLRSPLPSPKKDKTCHREFVTTRTTSLRQIFWGQLGPIFRVKSDNF